MLRQKGFLVELYLSSFKNKVIIALLSLPKEYLRLYAPMVKDLRLQLNPQALRAIYDGNQRQPSHSLDFMHARYSEAIEAQHIYKSNFIAAGSGVFQEPSRSKVFDSLLQSKHGCDIPSLLLDSVVIDCFAPHNEKKQIHLWSLCNRVWGTNPLLPLHRTKQILALRDYHGADVAFYLIFHTH